jgi:hypothetical protein
VLAMIAPATIVLAIAIAAAIAPEIAPDLRAAVRSVGIISSCPA